MSRAAPHPTWLKTFETVVSVKQSADPQGRSMKIGPVGRGMRSKQPHVGSDVNPSPAFHLETLKRTPDDESKKESTGEEFETWKKEKDIQLRERRKAEQKEREFEEKANTTRRGGASDDNEEEHKQWLKGKQRAMQQQARERKKEEAEFEARIARERDALVKRKEEKLKPHMQKKKQLLHLEREKYKAVTSGVALPANLAKSLKRLKKNPLNVDVVMVKVVDVNSKSKKKKKGKKGKKIAHEFNEMHLDVKVDEATPETAQTPTASQTPTPQIPGYGDDFEQPSNEDDGYGDDFDQPSLEEAKGGGDGYGDDFDEDDGEDGEAPSPLKPTPKKELAKSRERSRTFAFGPDLVNINKQPSLDPREMSKTRPAGMPLIPELTKSTPTIDGLKEKVNFEKKLNKLSAGQQYRHRRMIERSARNFHTVRVLRDTLHRDELKEQTKAKRAYDKWIKENPPKSGVENRPDWDNDFVNPEARDQQERDTVKAVAEARGASFRGQFGPGYGVDLHALPAGFGTGTIVDGMVLDGVETALDAIKQPDLLELGSFFQPPIAVKAVVGAVCTLLGISPSWDVAYKGLLRNSYYFLTMLRFFDKDGVDVETAMTLEQFMESDLFKEDVVEHGSRALVQLRNWVVAVWDYITGEELVRYQKYGRQGPPPTKATPKKKAAEKKEDTAAEKEREEREKANKQEANKFVIDATLEPNEYATTDYEESEDDDSHYGDDFDDNSHTVISATRLMVELEDLKKSLEAAKAEKRSADERVARAEFEKSRLLLEAEDEAAKKVQEAVDKVKEDFGKQETHDIQVVRKQMQEEADKKIALAVREATTAQAKELEKAKAGAAKVAEEVAALQTAAANKSRSAMELSAMLAKEKLMRKLADRKANAQAPVLQELLETTVDDLEAARLEEEKSKLKEELSLMASSISTVQTQMAQKDIVIMVQEGMLAANEWLSHREMHAIEGHEIHQVDHPGVDPMTISTLIELGEFFHTFDELTKEGPMVKEGTEGIEAVHEGAAQLKSLMKSFATNKAADKEEVAKTLAHSAKVMRQITVFDKKMQESNAHMDEVVNHLNSDLLDEVVRLWVKAKALGIESKYMTPLDNGVLEQVRERGSLATIESNIVDVAGVIVRLGEGYIHSGDSVAVGGSGLDPLEHYKEALRCFCVARCFNASDARMVMKVGVGFDDCNLFDESIDMFKEALKLWRRKREPPGVDAEIMYHLGEAMEHKGEKESALEVFGEASTLAAKVGNSTLVSECSRERGVILSDLGKFKEAAKNFGIACELDPTVPELTTAHAMSLKQAGLVNKAIKKYRMAKALYEAQGNSQFVEGCELEIKECIAASKTRRASSRKEIEAVESKEEIEEEGKN
ncbi:hypothetical protein TrVE_jg3950 [Triparma verrucosa]|uniref:Uncharacterized protein n=1 Tax=Triparma verrucosa TaxID=1606542 RepID=A0A9W7EQY8_9STRA|nr:hypothetical protein TrVE_jg3950 [Triparma verrucosa]